ncbi:HPr kinase/phosphorylase [Rhizobiaceae bacterium BDR2-2]|uniref:HPr kinase/phosphorylase n=1 Tax=Ectorhizobium quercum TaxID=2965071 RepID=A0AAE3N574_9HYPH|nr:HPr kinase/phosphorylase [Ectorhizobium quercum]MCX8999465.1 HPr kinase/phosphorylase [Ectorhizobium quercum]
MGEAGTRASSNVHATAIVVATTGLLFTGPSGSGKSTLAFTCMAAARRAGLFSALIADDQVFLDVVNGRVLARRPQAIAGLMEFRGTGIAEIESLPQALIHAAVRIVNVGESDRLPPENERFAVGGTVSLPLLRLAATTPDPLAVLCAFWPDLAGPAG